MKNYKISFFLGLLISLIATNCSDSVLQSDHNDVSTDINNLIFTFDGANTGLDIMGEIFNDDHNYSFVFKQTGPQKQVSHLSNINAGEYQLSIEITSHALLSTENQTTDEYASSIELRGGKDLNVTIALDSTSNDIILDIDEKNFNRGIFVIYATFDVDDWHNHLGIYKLSLTDDLEFFVNNDGYYGSLSPDNKYIYYRATHTASNIVRTNLRTYETEQITNYPDIHLFPRVSQDQSKVVWSEAFPDRNVYLFDRQDDSTTLLNNLHGYTVFFPNSNELLLNRGIIYDIYGNMLDTLINIRNDGWSIFINEFSPNGKYIVVLAQTPPYETTSWSNTINTRLFIFNTATNELSDITPNNVVSPNFIKRVDFVAVNGTIKIIYQAKFIIGLISIDGNEIEIIKNIDPNGEKKFGWVTGSHDLKSGL